MTCSVKLVASLLVFLGACRFNKVAGLKITTPQSCGNEFTLSDSQLSASSEWNKSHGAANAKLHHQGVGGRTEAWSTRHNNVNQWLQVDLRNISKVTRVTTQGRADANQWVKNYSIEYSLFGSHFVSYKVGGIEKVFKGNEDQDTEKSYKLSNPIIARYIRISPKSWNGHISMRVAFYGCTSGIDLPTPSCGEPLGLQSNAISDSQMTASSEWDVGHRAANARLNYHAGAGRTGAWSARYNNADQWLQVDFKTMTKITKIATQGRQDSYDQWLTSYTISYSMDGVFWKEYPEVFSGNSDRGTIVRHKFQQEMYARFLRIHPRTWHEHISLRAEVYGCTSGFQIPSGLFTCVNPLGMQNKTIPDSRITASSMWDGNHSPARARLGTIRVGQYRGAWSASTNDLGQWIQVDFIRATKVTRIATQGREDVDQWVSSYALQFSLDGGYFENYKKGRLLRGNIDRNSIVGNVLDPAIIGRYIRIRPKSWYEHISLRFELYGCKKGFDLPTPCCGEPLGLQSNAISDSQMTASSEWDVGHRAANARLNYHAGAGRTGAWSALYNNADQRLQVDFITMTKITKIATQGRQDSDQWLTSYTISYSMDGVFWKEYPEVFSGNSDRGTIVRHKFQQEIYARFLRIHPRTWHEHISLRTEVYGCTSGFQIPSGLVTCVNPLGMQNETIPDSRITASSMWDGNHSPARARLGTIRVGQYRGAWSASTNDLVQWIQVHFTRATKVTRIATQGREDVDQWVLSYAVQYSLDGGYFEDYNKGQVLRGNIDRNSIVGNILDPAIIGRYIRIRPKSWYGHISLRFELYGCKKGFDLPTPCCGEPLGLQSNAISDSQMTASSEWDVGHRAANARLNYHAGAGRTGAWSALYNNADQWLQVDFITMTKITKIATQGRQDSYDQWLTSYTISYSMDGVFWKEHPEVFSGNSDQGTIVRHKLLQEIYARYLRIQPRTWHEHISLRAEVYGCTSGFQIPSRLVTCVNPLGMQNKTIPDSRITASSMWDGNHSPARARLGTIRVGKYRGAWSASTNDLGQWIQVDFIRATKVTRIATQGREDVDQWVSSYAVQYSLDGGYFENYKKGQVLRGNTDRNSIVGNILDPAIIGRYIRIRPKSWYEHISLRFELYGCKKGFDLPTPCCGEPLGLQSNAISDSQMTTSSEWDVGHRAANARLNYHAGAGRTGAWSALYNNADQWLRVDFITMTKITKIATQGRQDSDQWLNSYTISYSIDGVFWKEYPEKVFSGNSDRETIVRHKFQQEIYARFLRIHPRTWHEHISLRVEIYGCTSGFQIPSGLVTCVNPLGMQNKTIPDFRITASSMWDGNHSPARARLGSTRVGKYSSAWSASTNDLVQWIQVHFTRATKVTRIATQGREDVDQWVSSYAMQFSLDSRYFENYHRMLIGNNNRNSMVGNVLDPAIIARYIRIRPKSWYRHISMRFEVYGCKQGFQIPSRLVTCVNPLGMQNKTIPDSRITASSMWDGNHSPARARLGTIGVGQYRGAWSASTNDLEQWIQVDCIKATKVTRIATQGREDVDQWVSSYAVQYSLDGGYFENYNMGRALIGNTDRNSIVGNVLDLAIIGRYIRILPKSWYGHISLRFELYGCKKSATK